MDSFALVLTLGLTFALGVVSARQVLEGVFYFMARSTASVPPTNQPPAPTDPTQA